MARKTQASNPAAPERLASVLANIAKQGAKLDDTAGEILAVLKENKVTTLLKFESVAAEAYMVNGWQKGAGRPKAGEELSPVPDAVKVYMSQIRKAYKARIKVTNYDSMYELRQAVTLANKRKPAQRDESDDDGEDDVAPELAGVRVADEDTLIGAAWHDAIVVYECLDVEDQTAFLRELGKLIDKYATQYEDIPKAKPGERVPVGVAIH